MSSKRYRCYDPEYSDEDSARVYDEISPQYAAQTHAGYMWSHCDGWEHMDGGDTKIIVIGPDDTREAFEISVRVDPTFHASPVKKPADE